MVSNLRKEKRIALKVYLKAKGRSHSGFQIDTQIHTENVSKSGMCFVCNSPIPIKNGDVLELELSNQSFKTRVKFKIVWKNGNKFGGYFLLKPEPWFLK